MRSRHCVDCGYKASPGARFCVQCGAALTLGATSLGAPIALEARILQEPQGIKGERKQVTVMYTDIVGSMELTAAVEGERWGFVLDRFLATAAGAVHEFEGTVNQFTGDGLMAVFGAPVGHEDHARRACLAVLELQREVASLAAELARADGVEFAVRCGLNSGEVIVGAIGDDVHMDFVPLGNTTALGKRIESLAPVGSTAMSGSTAALIEGEFELRDLGKFDVKGAEAPQRVWELVGPGSARTRLAAMAATRGLSRFVGREAERAALESALEQAVAGDGRALGIVGDPGVGKSRLVHEFTAGCAARKVTVSSTAALAHRGDVPLLPVLALYRDCFEIGPDDSPQEARERIDAIMLGLDPAFADDLPLLFEFLGVPDSERPSGRMDPRERQRRLLALLPRIIDARSGSEATVLVVEDLHWIDNASGMFLEALVATLAGTRTLLIATYRPDHDAAWTRTVPHTQIRLGPLDADATGALLTQLLGVDDSLDGLKAMIATRTGGNPFFIEEIVQALAEDGHLAGTRGAYELASELDALVLPVTVQAGLAARIDHLPVREKALVQTMSVIGNEISVPLLSEVSDLGARQLAEAIDVLARAQWVLPHDASDGREWVFKHPLTQEVAYRSQLSERRTHGHRTVAAAIELISPDGLDERAALLAHHCEAAGDMLKAAGWHARAAEWADCKAPVESMRHWRRVRDLADDLGAAGGGDELATTARIGLLSLGWRLGISADETTVPQAEPRTSIERFRVDLYSAAALMHSGREQEGLEGFRAASRQAVTAGDPGRILTASLGVAYANWLAGSLREGMETVDHALALAGRDPMTGSGVVFVCPLAHAFGHRGQCRGYLGELDQARRDFARAIALAREHDDLETESAAHANLALLDADAGDFDAALAGAALGLAIAERTANVVHIVASSTPSAVAQAATGRFADACAQAEANLATIRQQRVGLFYEPVLLATIARSRLELGETGGALAAAEEAVEIMDARGLATCALSAPVALAHILIATQGAAAGERIESVLGTAMRLAIASRARLFEPQVRRELAALARLRGDEVTARHEQAEAQRIVAALQGSSASLA